jgi:hypothetical protein
MPNPYTVPILPQWTIEKEAWVVKGHAHEIVAGNTVTVRSADDRLSLVTIGSSMAHPPHKSGEPMAIGWPIRQETR